MARPQATQGLLGSAALLPRNDLLFMEGTSTPLQSFLVSMRQALATLHFTCVLQNLSA